MKPLTATLVYIDEKMTDTQLAPLVNALRNIDGVLSVSYLSVSPVSLLIQYHHYKIPEREILAMFRQQGLSVTVLAA